VGRSGWASRTKPNFFRPFRACLEGEGVLQLESRFSIALDVDRFAAEGGKPVEMWGGWAVLWIALIFKSWLTPSKLA